MMIFPSLVLGALAFLLRSPPVHSDPICQRRTFYLTETVDMFANYTDLVSVTMSCSEPSFPEVTITAEQRLQEDTESSRSRNPKVEFSVTCSGVTEYFNRSVVVRKSDPWTSRIAFNSDIVIPIGEECYIIGCFYDDYSYNGIQRIQRRAAFRGSTCTINRNECASGTASCEYGCINTVAGYNCTCRSGYQLEDNLHNCTDVDECSTGEHACSYQCANTDGSYSCLCPTGFQLLEDNHTCSDIDECAGEHSCAYGCNNINGSFECYCETGFELDSTGYGCQDVNECYDDEYNSCDHMCNNTDGSYICLCDAGYTLSADQHSCFDIDECVMTDGLCSQVCKNTIGSYLCLCYAEYVLSDDGYNCTEVVKSRTSHLAFYLPFLIPLIFASALILLSIFIYCVFMRRRKQGNVLETHPDLYEYYLTKEELDCTYTPVDLSHGLSLDAESLKSDMTFFHSTSNTVEDMVPLTPEKTTCIVLVEREEEHPEEPLSGGSRESVNEAEDTEKVDAEPAPSNEAAHDHSNFESRENRSADSCFGQSIASDSGLGFATSTAILSNDTSDSSFTHSNNTSANSDYISCLSHASVFNYPVSPAAAAAAAIATAELEGSVRGKMKLNHALIPGSIGPPHVQRTCCTAAQRRDTLSKTKDYIRASDPLFTEGMERSPPHISTNTSHE